MKVNFYRTAINLNLLQLDGIKIIRLSVITTRQKIVVLYIVGQLPSGRNQSHTMIKRYIRKNTQDGESRKIGNSASLSKQKNPTKNNIKIDGRFEMFTLQLL